MSRKKCVFAFFIDFCREITGDVTDGIIESLSGTYGDYNGTILFF